MRRIEFHPEAANELDEAQKWYHERSSIAAQAFALEVDRALSLIAEDAEKWPLTEHGERRIVLRRFPYTILYRLRGDAAFVVAVSHQRRLPGYWLHRG